MECEERIARKRLHAVPWALYCVKCQEQLAAPVGGPGRELAAVREPARY